MKPQNGAALIKNRGRLGGRPRAKPLMPVNDGLADDRMEAFATMVCDGMSLAEAFRRAGFTGTRLDAFRLWRDHEGLQARAKAILEERARTSPVTLPEITSMLQRVFAGSLADADYSPAHNAAFSLARLYGLVIDRAQIDTLRRPSRDPDAPAETALADWVSSLPSLASPAGPEPSNLLSALANPPGLEGPSPANGSPVPPGEIENGAPRSPVTGTPSGGARDLPVDNFGFAALFPEVLAEIRQEEAMASSPEDQPTLPAKKKRVPRKKKKGPLRRGLKKRRSSSQGPKAPEKPKKPPTFKDLFG